MFTKLNESGLFKSLSAAFRSSRKEIVKKKAAAANRPETRKTEEPMSGDKAVRSLSFATRYQIYQSMKQKSSINLTLTRRNEQLAAELPAHINAHENPEKN